MWFFHIFAPVYTTSQHEKIRIYRRNHQLTKIENMELNKEYIQIIVDTTNTRNSDYETLKGKVVDKVGFVNCGTYDNQMLVIIFSDKTFIAFGPEYNDTVPFSGEPTIINRYKKKPKTINNGDYRCHSFVDTKGKLRFDQWIDTLRDLGLWIFTDEDAKEIMDARAKYEEEREYQNYLRLKEKFEK